MENALQIFNNSEFGNIRTVTEGDVVLFCGRDIAAALGYSNLNDALSRHCKGGVKRDTLTAGGRQELTFISEGDVYRLVCGSRLETAAKFERWIFDEVVPAVRKNGAYLSPEAIEKTLTNPDFIIKLATNWKNEQAKNAQLTKKIVHDAPKVLFANSVMASDKDILIRELAKIIKQNGGDIGADKLFAWLHEKGYLIGSNSRDRNCPTAKSINMGLMRIKKHAVIDSNGNTIITTTPLITPKGQIYFVNKFINKPTETAVAF